MRIRKLNHSIYQVQYHILWVTKYRRKYIKEYVKVELIKSLYKVKKTYPTWYFHAVNTDKDHVHLIVEIPPKDSLAYVVQRLKSCTSADLKKKFPFIRHMYEEEGIWSVGYFVSTIGMNEERIRKYVEQQGMQDRGSDATGVFS